MSYTDSHKILLQALMQHGILDEIKAKDLTMKLFGDDKASIIMNQINEKLKILDMLIKEAKCEISGGLYWVLTSTTIDNVTRFQDEFSNAQLALLRTIFSEIIMSHEGCIQSTMCLNLCSSMEVKLSKAEAEEFLTDIVERKWLNSENGHYYIGVKSIAELMPYFKEMYGDNLKVCCLCKQVTFFGKKCNQCHCLIHLFCLKKFAEVYNPAKCPECDTIFPVN